MEHSQSKISDVLYLVYKYENGKVSIGGQEIQPQIISHLKDEANSLLQSEIWSILEASILNESMRLALTESASWDHVLSAKMLKHWHFFLKKLLTQIAK